MASVIKRLQDDLDERGYSSSVLKEMHNAKICIVDDKIEELQSFVEGLNNEGFTNISMVSSVESISQLTEPQFDLVILDLVGVAPQLSSDDGIGILQNLKQLTPTLPVLVISGEAFTADKAKMVAAADMVRSKPVLPAELSADVRELLKVRKDPFWRALTLLRELQVLAPDVTRDLGAIDKIRLRYYCWRVERSIWHRDPGVIDHMLPIVKTLMKLGAIAQHLSYLIAV